MSIEAKNKISRGINNIIIEKTSGPGESTAETTERITVVSLHFANRKVDVTRIGLKHHVSIIAILIQLTDM